MRSLKHSLTRTLHAEKLCRCFYVVLMCFSFFSFFPSLRICVCGCVPTALHNALREGCGIPVPVGSLALGQYIGIPLIPFMRPIADRFALRPSHMVALGGRRQPAADSRDPDAEKMTLLLQVQSLSHTILFEHIPGLSKEAFGIPGISGLDDQPIGRVVYICQCV
jgi:hypothetical protein